MVASAIDLKKEDLSHVGADRRMNVGVGSAQIKFTAVASVFDTPN
jgi:hypothetical protein